MANVEDHIQNVEDALDAMASDPDVPSEEYEDALRDLAYRCTAAADQVKHERTKTG